MPDSLVEKIKELRHEITEAAVEHDDALLEKYLGGEELTEEELSQAIRTATIADDVFEVGHDLPLGTFRNGVPHQHHRHAGAR